MNSTALQDANARFDAALRSLPLIAILRGLRPDEAPAIGAALAGEGWTLVEVPLNSPQPLRSIEALSNALPNVLVGAGTVLRVSEVHEVHAAGGRFVVAPNFDAGVVAAAMALDMICLPGVATATEAFAALAAGASALKLFPAEMIAPSVVKALRAVLPATARLLPVGGITPGGMAGYLDAGANGFGLGSALYRPGLDAAGVAANARAFVSAWRACPTRP
jgi:2-dehydro-3-deoxyphosphogalactonate aldolase